jgi:hypothetical protein
LENAPQLGHIFSSPRPEIQPYSFSHCAPFEKLPLKSSPKVAMGERSEVSNPSTHGHFLALERQKDMFLTFFKISRKCMTASKNREGQALYAHMNNKTIKNKIKYR